MTLRGQGVIEFGALSAASTGARILSPAVNWRDEAAARRDSRHGILLVAPSALNSTLNRHEASINQGYG
jgi:hypothetical protein